MVYLIQLASVLMLFGSCSLYLESRLPDKVEAGGYHAGEETGNELLVFVSECGGKCV